MINEKKHPNRHREEVPAGKTVAFCRCWHSGKFPYCDGTHRKLNAENGDSVGPVIVIGVAADASLE